jgi:hypothetical protein
LSFRRSSTGCPRPVGSSTTTGTSSGANREHVSLRLVESFGGLMRADGGSLVAYDPEQTGRLGQQLPPSLMASRVTRRGSPAFINGQADGREYGRYRRGGAAMALVERPKP